MKYLQNLHTHSTYCDGKDTPEEMILSAFEFLSREQSESPALFGDDSYSTGLPWQDERNGRPPLCQPLSYYNYYKNHQ